MSEEQQALGSGNTQLLLPIQHTATQVQQSHPSGDAHSVAQGRPGNVGSVRQYLNAAIANNTRRAYQQDLRDFIEWGGTVPSSPESLAAYIAARAETLSVHTITRRIVGISRAHVSQGHAEQFTLARLKFKPYRGGKFTLSQHLACLGKILISPLNN